jgi:hypothetical protein
MATIKAISGSQRVGSCGQVISYVMNEYKTEQELVYGKDCFCDTIQQVKDDFKETKIDWDKTKGRQYYHLIQSFEKDEKITPAMAHEIGRNLIDKDEKFKDFQVLMVTHTDKDHLHNHFVVNSVSLTDGKKFTYSQRDLINTKELSNKLCLEKDLKIIDLNQERTIDHKEPRYTLAEEHMLQRWEYPWKSFLRDGIERAEIETIEICSKTNISDRQQIFDKFRECLETQNIDITRGLNENNKSITFEDRLGNKCRGNKLDAYYKNRANICNNLEREIGLKIEIKQEIEIKAPKPDNSLIKAFSEEKGRIISDLKAKGQKLENEAIKLTNKIKRAKPEFEEAKQKYETLKNKYENLTLEENKKINSLDYKDFEVKGTLKDRLFNKSKLEEQQEENFHRAKEGIKIDYDVERLLLSEELNKAKGIYNDLNKQMYETITEYKSLKNDILELKNQQKEMELQTEPTIEFKQRYEENQKEQEIEKNPNEDKKMEQEQEIDYSFTYEYCLEKIEDYRKELSFEYPNIWDKSTREEKLKDYQEYLLERAKEINQNTYQKLKQELEQKQEIELEIKF